MCTLTYLPTGQGFTFTHNRDERVDRPSSKDFKVMRQGEYDVYFPQDLEARGSWIAFSTEGRAVCLLNGGSRPHQRKASYRHSRGLVVLDNFKFRAQEDFYRNYNLEDIEPFTLIVKDREGLWKLTHDEGQTDLIQLNEAETGIWSSTTLYTREVRDKRRKWFYSWLEDKPELSPGNIRRFHKSAGDGDEENDLIMSRWGLLKTVSITQIHTTENRVSLHYEDFMQNSVDSLSFTP